VRLRQLDSLPMVAVAESEGESTSSIGSLIAHGDALYLCRSAEPGQYGRAAMASAGVDLHGIATRWQNATSQIVLSSLASDSACRARDLCTEGRHGNPAVCSHGGELVAAWEDHRAGRVDIVVVDVETGSAIPIPSPAERCYRPILASAGNALYLAYERFTGDRYQLECRVATDFAKGFGEATVIGFPDGNDMMPSLAVDGDGVFIAWENSIPLQAGWTHATPKSDITMPAFGHGWRVETKVGLRRLSCADNGVESEDLTTDGAPEVELDANRSAGAPTIVVVEDCPVLAYLTISSKSWQLVLKQLSDGMWQELDIPELYQHERVPPAVVVLQDGKLAALGTTADGEMMVVDVDLLVAGSRPCFRAAVRPLSRREVIRMPHSAAADGVEEGGRKLQLFWGDLHMHTNISECSLNTFFHCTEPEEKYRYARDIGRLDFAMMTDHAESMEERSRDWQRTVDAAERAHEPGHFVPFLGYEWTANGWGDLPIYGHYNVLFRDSGPLYSSKNPASDNPAKLWSQLQVGEVLTIPHHPGCPRFLVDWSFYHPDFVPLVEIFQVRGSYEYANCPMGPQAYGRVGGEGETIDAGCIRTVLGKNYKLGFTAGGEHEGVGVTAVFAEELTRDGIFAALRRRSVYGTTGDRIFVEFRVDGALMGSEIPASEAPELSIRVAGTTDIASITVVRDGEEVHRWLHLDSAVDLSWRDETAGSYYYAVIRQTNGEMAWTSPVFLAG
jgi:hypothetical protein